MAWTNLWICGPLPLKIPVKNFFRKFLYCLKTASEPPSNFKGSLGRSFYHSAQFNGLKSRKITKMLDFFYHFRPKTIEIQPKNKLLSLQEAIFVERF